MFLFRKPCDRAIGLVAAYALLFTGVIVNAGFEAAPAKRAPVQLPVEPRDATHVSVDRSKTWKADDCSFALQCRSDTVC